MTVGTGRIRHPAHPAQPFFIVFFEETREGAPGLRAAQQRECPKNMPHMRAKGLEIKAGQVQSPWGHNSQPLWDSAQGSQWLEPGSEGRWGSWPRGPPALWTPQLLPVKTSGGVGRAGATP